MLSLTRNSIPSRLRTPLLSRLLRPELATARTGFWIHHLGDSDVHARGWRFGQSKQGLHGSEGSWYDILEDRSLCRDLGFGDEFDQPCCGKLTALLLTMPGPH